MQVTLRALARPAGRWSERWAAGRSGGPLSPRRIAALRVLAAVAVLGLLAAGASSIAHVFDGGSAAAVRPPSDTHALSGAGATEKADRAYGKLPLAFEANRGQTDRRVRFLSRGPGYALFLTGHEAVLSLSGPQANRPERGAGDSPASAATKIDEVLRMRLVGANRNPQVTGRDRLAATTNYLIGNDRTRWRTGVASYAQVRYRAVYPGIDQIYHGKQRQLEYDFVVRPGADPGRIRLDFGGARKLTLDRRGDLLVHTRAGILRQKRPVVYQTVGGERRPVSGRYVLNGGRRVGFALGSYDRSRALVIDPVLAYSTYLGGSGGGHDYPFALEAAYGIAIEPDCQKDCEAYVVGVTGSTDFPSTTGAYQPANRGGGCTYGCTDLFISKLSADGSKLVYSTYLGGTGYESSRNVSPGGVVGSDKGRPDIAVDAEGNAYLTGVTSSLDFPTTATSAFQPVYGGERPPYTSPVPAQGDAFLAKLDPQGSGLAYSSYLGGSSDDLGHSIAVDSDGNAFVTGATLSPNFPTTADAYDRLCASGACSSRSLRFDAFLAKVDTRGSGPSSLKYSSYLGGERSDSGNAIAVHSGKAYVTGITDSEDFPTKDGYQSAAPGGESDAFVSVIDPGSAGAGALAYSTYLGGSDYDGTPLGVGSFQPAPGYNNYTSGSIATDSDGAAYVAGITKSADFPTKGAAQQAKRRYWDAFVTKLDPATPGAGSLVYSTYFGGDGTDAANAIAVDDSGSAYLTGVTGSRDFPLQDAFQETGGDHPTSVTINGSSAEGSQSVDAFAAKIAPTGSAVSYSSYLGGKEAVEEGNAIALDAKGDAYLAGEVAGGDLPTLGLQARSGDGAAMGDGFAAKVASIPGGAPVVSALTPRSGPPTGGTDVAIRGSGLSGATAVDFGGVRATIKSVNAQGTIITAQAPPHDRERVLVTVSAAGGISPPNAYAAFTYSQGALRQTGSPVVDREYHTATVLEDGRVLIAGGGNVLNGPPLSSVELYDPVSETFTATAAMDSCAPSESCVARAGHAAALLWTPACAGASRPSWCGTVLVVGGGPIEYAGGQGEQYATYKSAELYDPAADGGKGGWSPARPPSVRRAGATATALWSPACGGSSPPGWCGKVLVFGGARGGLETYGAIGPERFWTELYDPATGEWSSCPPPMTPTPDCPGAFEGEKDPIFGGPVNGLDYVRVSPLSDGRLLAIGGGVDKTSHVYDPATGQWEKNGATMQGRDYGYGPGSAALVAGGKVAVAGAGRGSPGRAERFSELYDPAANGGKGAWEPAGSLINGRGNSGSTLTSLPNGKALVAGGAPEDGATAEAEVLDPQTKAWSAAGFMSRNRYRGTATLLSSDPHVVRGDRSKCGENCGKVLLLGGEDPRIVGLSPSADLYTPAPSVSEVSPGGGPSAGGTPVTIRGTGFTNGLRSVRFGDAAVTCPSSTCVVDSYERISVVSPAHAAGAVDVTVINEGGASEPRSFTYAGGTPTGPGGGSGGGGVGTAPGDGGGVRTAPGDGGPQGGSGGPGLVGPVGDRERSRAVGWRRCLTAVRRHVRRERGRARRSSGSGRARARRHLRRHGRSLRRRCVSRFGRVPGRVGGVRARGVSQTRIALSFRAVGSDGKRPPAARSYLVKQSRAPIRGGRDFRRAQTLCGGACRFPATRVGARLTLTITGLRARSTYHYAVAARDNVSGRLGPRSRVAQARTP